MKVLLASLQERERWFAFNQEGVREELTGRGGEHRN